MRRSPHQDERPVLRPIARLMVLGLLLAVSAGPAAADEKKKLALAPAGACAEPREALSGTGMGGSDFAVAGPIGSLFSPADVAAPPPLPQRGSPSPTGVVRPGACDQPGADCAPTVQITVPSVPDPPVLPGPRPVPTSRIGLPDPPVLPGPRPGRD